MTTCAFKHVGGGCAWRAPSAAVPSIRLAPASSGDAACPSVLFYLAGTAGQKDTQARHNRACPAHHAYAPGSRQSACAQRTPALSNLDGGAGRRAMGQGVTWPLRRLDPPCTPCWPAWVCMVGSSNHQYLHCASHAWKQQCANLCSRGKPAHTN